MTQREIFAWLEERIPRELSLSCDNDGLMCCSSDERAVGRILVTLDVTEEVIDYAKDNGFDLIVSHHPLIFRPIGALNSDNLVSRKVIELIRSDIAVMSFHTRLDALHGGVNDVLANALGLKEIECFGEGNIGRIGVIDEALPLKDFAKIVKEALGAPCVLSSDSGKDVKRIAVLGGEGGDDIGAAILSGADTMVSGRLGYHKMVDAREMGINLIEAGHFYTEFPVCKVLRSMLCEMDESAYIEIFNSNRIEMI